MDISNGSAFLNADGYGVRTAAHINWVCDSFSIEYSKLYSVRNFNKRM